MVARNNNTTAKSPEAPMQLYTFWRSIATFRVRTALNLKGLTYEPHTIDLFAGDQHKPEFLGLNPMAAIPVFIDDDGTMLQQSLPIMEYLEERYPQNPLMPKDFAARARVRALAQMTIADTHPLTVPRVRNYLSSLGATPEVIEAWAKHWLVTGLDAYEKRLAGDKAAGDYCQGNQLTIADICLVGHVAAAKLFGVNSDAHPTIKRITDRCLTDERIASALPLRQPGAPAAKA
jgi:maleylacetoacetate isomerase